MYGSSVLNMTQAAIYVPIVITLASLATGLALAIGGIDLLGGAISAGTLVAFMAYTRHFFDPVEQLGHWFAEMQMAQASAERILSLIEAEPEIRDSANVRHALASQRQLPAGRRFAADGGEAEIQHIELRHVSFAYNPDRPVLEDINLTVHRGETIAIVGPTGGGKSTLVNLICRFYEPTRGQVLIDGVDYRARSLHWLQSNLGMVLQNAHVFSGSILDNIRYGRLDASDREVHDAARLAGAHAFIEQMEHGYATEAGEGGSRLSAGQKQLVSFARAILADPQILVMDEATSSVDTETEQRIQQGLANVLDGRIAFVIAHRLSTIRNAHRIVVVDAARISETGTHDALMAARGHYYELYRQQSLQESSARLGPSKPLPA
jgi:ATP-binding cassette subfamily B protein